ncbi:uncharacterized protein LOC100832558 isoform X2 [Brachypodium distachyon]|uniref:Uncharacterized protein n=1 Tax=Brachypodium distachyon TaxID=15368 RepID=I1HZ69_BRADI|nr:uncharacterized protein LOC100832558 isoform X2 [Brachypodium distachyon]KQJ94219.1 hypothetical protein BRADI_3g09280v3 [Brachypodium distachyon]|eukprot:XP_010234092.1 uncharacterized protein LOC100832558 isoform X2 [Brachypodium distachyon]
MELSAAFEERVRQMEDARNHRLSLLQAEKEIQAAKSRLLGAKVATARRLEHRRLLLERRAADLASRTLAARAVIDATHARRLVVARDLSLVRAEIEEAERKEEDWDRFYESKRKEMQQFQAMSQQFEVEASKEVQMLKDMVSQLQSTLQEHQSSGMYSNDADIAAAEARKSDLTSKKAKLDESLASARQFRALLQKQLQKAFASQVGDQKATQN